MVGIDYPFYESQNILHLDGRGGDGGRDGGGAARFRGGVEAGADEVGVSDRAEQ